MRFFRNAAASALVLAIGVSSAAAQVVQYYHLDVVGNVRVVTNQAGALIERHDYMPFGEEISPPGGQQPLRFTGKERDAETGLDYFGARYYTSTIARFTTADPRMSIKANLADPQQWNRYAYARNNPFHYVDPTGEEATVAVTCGGSRCQVSVTASIAIYAVSGTTSAQLATEQAALTGQINAAWTGFLALGGKNYDITTSVTVTPYASKADAIASGAQNVIAIDASSTATNHIDPHYFGRGRAYDTGVFDFAQTTTGLLGPHEFSHILGLDDNHGEALSNSFSSASTGWHPHATTLDFAWAFGPELLAGKTGFNVGMHEGTNFWGVGRGNRNSSETGVEQKDH